MLTSSVKFTLKAACDNIRKKDVILQNYKDLWMKGIPFKDSFFLWRLWMKRILIGEILIRNGMCDSVIFCCCEGNVQETIEHLFMQCRISNYL